MAEPNRMAEPPARKAASLGITEAKRRPLRQGPARGVECSLRRFDCVGGHGAQDVSKPRQRSAKLVQLGHNTTHVPCVSAWENSAKSPTYKMHYERRRRAPRALIASLPRYGGSKAFHVRHCDDHSWPLSVPHKTACATVDCVRITMAVSEQSLGATSA